MADEKGDGSIVDEVIYDVTKFLSKNPVKAAEYKASCDYGIISGVACEAVKDALAEQHKVHGLTTAKPVSAPGVKK